MLEWLRLGAVGVLAFAMANVVLGGAGRSAACRVIYAAIGGVVLAVFGVLWLLVGGLSGSDWSIVAGVATAAALNGLRVQNAFGRSWVLPSWGKFDWLAGALVVAVLIFGVGGGKSKPKQEAAPAVPIEQKPATKCACYSGTQCTGPKGGKYCIDASGNKRY